MRASGQPASNLPSPKPIFARHETFAPRFGWLTKGYSRAAEDPAVFSGLDAALQLGVGKNMARSIRYWCHAFKLLDFAPGVEAGSRPSVATPLGEALMGEGGWDPYLEMQESLWLLHWALVSAPSQASAWRFVFTEYSEQEFTTDQVLAALAAHVARLFPAARLAPSSLRKDVTCIVRMYANRRDDDGFTEDTIQSPFAELGLIRVMDRDAFRFDVGEKPSLPAEVVVKACLDYAAETSPGVQTLPVSRLLLGSGSPGMAFRLAESALCMAIEEVGAKNPAIRLAEAAGLAQMVFNDDPRAIANHVLAGFYASRAGRQS